MINIFKNDAYNKVVINHVNDKIKKGHKVDPVLLEKDEEPNKSKLKVVVDNTKEK